MTMTRKPYEDTCLAKYLTNCVQELRPKAQAAIAIETGFVSANKLTMIQQGDIKLASDRVPALAKALDCDPAWLLRLAPEPAEGSIAAASNFEIIGQLATANDRAWIAKIRDGPDVTDP